jgi:hypothetical protein
VGGAERSIRLGWRLWGAEVFGAAGRSLCDAARCRATGAIGWRCRCVRGALPAGAGHSHHDGAIVPIWRSVNRPWVIAPPESDHPGSAIGVIQFDGERSCDSADPRDRFDASPWHSLHDRLGDLCCPRNYVACGSLTRRASRRLRAEHRPPGGWRFRSRGHERNIFRPVSPSRPWRCGSTTSQPDSTETYLEAATELRRCVLDRIEAPHRDALPLPPVAAPPALIEILNPPEICCAGELHPLPTAAIFGRGQHSSERNIGRWRRPRWDCAAAAVEFAHKLGGRVGSPVFLARPGATRSPRARTKAPRPGASCRSPRACLS